MRNPIDGQQGQLWQLIPAATQNNKLAIFVHGFGGNYLTTWGYLGELLRKRADTDPVLKDWDYMFVGYDTSNVSSYLDIAARIATFYDSAVQGNWPFEAPYKSIALFAHSLGTLGVRQLLCDLTSRPSNFDKHLKSVTLIGSPKDGSRLAKLVTRSPLVLALPIGRSLEPKSPQLRMLKSWTKSTYKMLKDCTEPTHTSTNSCSEPVHTVRCWPQVKLVVGQDDKVVGYSSETWEGDNNLVSHSALDHSALVKPGGWISSDVMSYIRAGLK